jgi:glycosyltransferase involved in cell wall biosynthesis
VRAVVVGDGAELPRLRAALPWAGYAGRQQGVDLARHVASADLLVFPSLSESFGQVVPEAMASGVAVAASIIGGGMHQRWCRGILRRADRRPGRRLRPAADLPGRAMGEAARLRAEGMGWDAVASALEPVLVQAAATGRPA